MRRPGPPLAALALTSLLASPSTVAGQEESHAERSARMSARAEAAGLAEPLD